MNKLAILLNTYDNRHHDSDWQDQAACTTEPVATFFPTSWDGPTRARAVAICTHCPARGDCFAAHLRERDGIWGGATPRQRRSLRTLLHKETIAA